jgi:hypothetical protein
LKIADAAVVNAGFAVDDIAVTGFGTDDLESNSGWTEAGFIRTI